MAVKSVPGPVPGRSLQAGSAKGGGGALVMNYKKHHLLQIDHDWGHKSYTILFHQLKIMIG